MKHRLEAIEAQIGELRSEILARLDTMERDRKEENAAIEKRRQDELATFNRWLDGVFNQWRVLAEHAGLRDKAEPLNRLTDEYFESRRPPERQSHPEPKTDPGFKNGE
jgi:hypothetical protein